eukprot:sb/3474018/
MTLSCTVLSLSNNKTSGLVTKYLASTLLTYAYYGKGCCLVSKPRNHPFSPAAIFLLTLSVDGMADPIFCKQPIRSRYLGHVTGYQPIRDKYFLIRSVFLTWQTYPPAPQYTLVQSGASDSSWCRCLFSRSKSLCSRMACCLQS